MKKTLLISSGVLILILLLTVWMYLLFFGAPEQIDDVFSDLPFTNNSDAVVVEEEMGEDTFTDSAEDTFTQNPLRQITTEPIAGFTILQTNNGTNTADGSLIAYVESGTGHVYEYNPASGERTRISNTTIPETSNALITTTGEFVINESASGIQILDLENDSQSTVLDINNWHNLYLINDTHLLYTTREGEGEVAKAYNITNQTTQTLFIFPTQHITVSWGSELTADHIVYNRPANGLPSYAYIINNGNRSRLPISGTSLNLFHNDNYIVYSYTPTTNNPGDRVSVVYNRDTDESLRLATPTLREKCTFGSADVVFCGNTLDTSISLTDWYKGLQVGSDSILRINLTTGASSHLTSTERSSGRAVDIRNMTELANILIFNNKTNDTLWLYEQN